MSRLLIIDGHAVIHRAYHSIPMLTFNGAPVNAIYGFYSMLLTAIDTLKPTHLIVCLDSPGPTLRQQEFIGYRSQRRPADKDLISQLPLLPKTLDQAHICNYSMGGYEADDLIATIARRVVKNKKNRRVYIVTGDKDLMQLVTPQIKLFMPIRGLSQAEIVGPKKVRQKLSVSPSQIVDLKALMGDPSDNYPGVAGIGPKTASSLLASYGDLDNTYAHLDDLAPTVKDKLVKDKDNAYLSRQLATLVDDIPLQLSLKCARWDQQLLQHLLSTFGFYNFKSLSSRLQKQFGLKPSPLKPDTDTNQTSLF